MFHIYEQVNIYMDKHSDGYIKKQKKTYAPKNDKKKDDSDGHGNNKQLTRVNYNMFPCANCGMMGHIRDNCTLPIISIGIILLKISDIDQKELSEILKYKTEDKTDMKLNIVDTVNIYMKVHDMVKFLMICRRHTLGYSEFIRGRYFIEDKKHIKELFDEMIKDEISRICNNKDNFSVLWENFWNEPSKNSYNSEFKKAKFKFDMLTNTYIDDKEESIVDHFAKTAKLQWSNPEWGFPKGRKKINAHETDLECAMREFEEETGFTKEDYIIIDDMQPFVEDLTGSDSRYYRHIYYVGLSTSDKMPYVDKQNDSQSSEIGNIGYFSLMESLNMIRRHHYKRKEIMSDLFKDMSSKIVKKMLKK